MLTAAGHATENDRAVKLVQACREGGDRRAMERLLDLHRGILIKVVRRYSGHSGEPYEDLMQVGYVGLIKAVNDYDAGSPATFSTYAYAKIEGELRHHLRDTGLVRRPRWARSLYAKIAEATTKLTGELGRPPLVEEIAREVNVAPEGVTEVTKLFADTNVSSLDGERDGEDGPDLSAIKSLRYEAFSLPIEDRILLEQSLESLTELQRKAVYLFFYKDLSQTEIGKRLGLPQRKISTIISDATKSLSKKMRAQP
jgi:RNA polymerase sigma-B factor